MPEYRNTKHPGIPTIYYVKTIGHRIRSVSCMHNNYYNSNVHAFCDNNVKVHTYDCMLKIYNYTDNFLLCRSQRYRM